VIEELMKKQSVPVVRVEPPSPPQHKPERVENGAPPPEPAPTVEPNIKGLKNSGVICFFNSVLQNLIQTPMLRACLEYTCEG